MLMKRLRYSALAAAVVAGLLVWGMGMTSAGPSGPKRLVIALPAEVIMLDPAQYQDLNSHRAFSQIFDTFIQTAEDSFRKVPGLVERWEVTPDGLVYTFRLRRGVKFHDGSPFNAEAARFHFERQMDKNHPFYGMGTWSRAGTYLVPFIEKFEAVDDSTLKMTLKKKNSSILDYLNHGIARVVSMEAVKKHGKDFPLQPVGTGPFKFVSWEKGVRLVLEKNPDYWGGAPRIDQVIYVGIPEASARLVALRTGAADVTLDVPVDEIANLRQDRRFTVQMVPSLQVLFLAFNFKTRPLDDVRVRRALNYAVDKESIVKEVLKGTGVVAKTPISPAFGDYHNPQVQGYPYNPETARRLLREANWPADKVLTYMVPESGSGMQAPQPIATIIQANLQAVGVRTQIRTYEWSTYLTKFRAPEYDIGTMSWNPPVGDPVVMLYSLMHTSNFTPKGWNTGFYDNKEVDRIIDAYTEESAQQRRVTLMRDLQRATHDDPPWVYVDHQIIPVVMTARVRNFRMHPSFVFILTKVDIQN